MDKHHITIKSPTSTRYVGTTDNDTQVFDIDLTVFEDDDTFEIRIVEVAKFVESLGFKTVTYKWLSQSTTSASGDSWHIHSTMSIKTFIAWVDPASPY